MTSTRSAILPAPQIETRTGNGWVQEIGDFFRQFIAAAFDPYRPELHYMRGPGPACRAREGLSTR